MNDIPIIGHVVKFLVIKNEVMGRDMTQFPVKLFLIVFCVSLFGSYTFVQGQETLVKTSALSSAWDDEGSGEADLEKRLKDLEKDYSGLSKELNKILEADKKKKEEASKKPTFKINGRIHADFWSYPSPDAGIGFFENSDPADASFGEDPNDRFEFRRVRFETKGDILDTMLWRIQFEFGAINAPTVKDVYLGFKDLPWNQTLLIGNQKRPIGLDHLNSSRANVFLERPFAIEAFNEDARRVGLGMYGYSDDEYFHWRYGIFYLQNTQGIGFYNGDSRQMSGHYRLSMSPMYECDGQNYLHFAFSTQVAHPDGDAGAADPNNNEGRFRTRPEARTLSRWLDTGRIAGADWYETGALEAVFNHGPLQIVSEYQHTFMQRNNGFQDVEFGGGYVYANYVLTGEHIPYSRKTGTIGLLDPARPFRLMSKDGKPRGWGAFAVGLRYSYLDLTDQDVTGGVGESLSLGLNWYWNKYARWQFNLMEGQIRDRTNVGGFDQGKYTALGTRFSIQF